MDFCCVYDFVKCGLSRISNVLKRWDTGVKSRTRGFERMTFHGIDLDRKRIEQ